MACPNTKSPAWKALVNKIGVREAYREFLKHGDIPDAANYKETFRGVNATLKVLEALSSDKMEGIYNKFYANNKDKFYAELSNAGATKQQIQLLKQWNEENNPTSLPEMQAGIASEMTFTVEIDVATESIDNGEIPIGTLTEVPSRHYDWLNVPGGTNYRENEIRTPEIIPAITGHAQFSTDQGIGWFRSDDKKFTEEIELEELENNEDESSVRYVKSYPEISGPKTRRILEVQSDLFQKGRDKEDLIIEENQRVYDPVLGYAVEPEIRKTGIGAPKNNFLQLLNKDNAWVTFFVKSIIQDSARKGYEEVVFPAGDTASKIEGHESVEEFVQGRRSLLETNRKDEEAATSILKEYKETGTLREVKYADKSLLKEGNKYYSIPNEHASASMRKEEISKAAFDRSVVAQVKAFEEALPRIAVQKEQLEREIENALGPQGMASFSKIHSFYEKDVQNILRKQGYAPERITDEHTNDWFKIKIDPVRDFSSILLQVNSPESVSSVASAGTVKKIKEFLERIGVTTQSVGNIYVAGKKIGANAIAEPLAGLIRVTQGKENIALPEEAMHIAVELVEQKNPRLFKQMFNQIGRYKIFDTILQDYKNIPYYQTKDGRPDIIKLKKEAIGKVLAEAIIKKNEGTTEKPELLAQVVTWWQRIVDYLKSIFLKAQMNPFEEAAEVVTERPEELGNVSDLTNNSGVFLQLSDKEIYDKLKLTNENLSKVGEKYEINGEPVRHTTMEDVNDYLKRRFGNQNPSEAVKAAREFKKDTEDKAKQDVNDILSRYIDDEGNLRTAPLDHTNPSAVDPNDNTYYNTIEEYIKNRLASYPAGTKFMKNVHILDSKTSTAGTIDLLAITPLGDVDISQFKVPDLPVNAQDIPLYRQESYNIEIEALRKILERGYGIKRSQFKYTRAIPIKAIYTYNVPGVPQTGLKLAEMKMGNTRVELIKDDILLPVPSSSESTGVENFDKFVSRLRGLVQKLAETRVNPDKRGEKTQRIASLVAAIRKLVIQKDADGILTSGKAIVKSQQEKYDRLLDAIKNTDPSKATIEELNKIAGEILDEKDQIELYVDLYKAFKNVFDDGSDISKGFLNQARDISDEATDILDKFWEMSIKFRKEKLSAKLGITDEFRPEKQLTWYRRMVRSLSQSSIKAGEILWGLVKNINNRFQLQFQDRLKELRSIQEGLDNWLKGKTIQDLYKKIFQFKNGKWNGRVIQKISREFYTQLRKAQEDGSLTWVKSNIDVDAYKAWYLEEHKRLVEVSKTARYHPDDTENKIIIRRQLEEYVKTFSIRTTSGVNRNNYRLKDFPKLDKWESEEYKELRKPENEPVLKLYNHWVDRLQESWNSGMIDEHNGWSWFPNVRRNLLEKLTTAKAGNKLTSIFGDIRIEAEDESFGKIDPLTGKSVDEVHANYVTDLGQWVKGTDDNYFKDYSEKSMDVFKVLALWDREIIKFKLKTESESLARMLAYTEEKREALKTKRTGGVERDKDGRLITVSNDINAKYIREHIEAVYYNKGVSDESDIAIEIPYKAVTEKINKIFGREILQVPEEETITVSGVKALGAMNRFFVTKTLGLNVLTSAANLFGGSVNSFINQGLFFDKKDLAESELEYVSGRFYKDEQSKKMAGLLGYFHAYTEDKTGEDIRDMSVSNAVKYLSSDHLFYLQRGSDNWVNNIVAMSFIKNTMLKDDKLVNIREYAKKELGYKDKYAGTYEQAKEFEKKLENRIEELKKSPDALLNKAEIKDDKIVIPGLTKDSEQVINLRQSMLEFTKSALGNTSREDLSLYKRSVMWQSFFMFKNWIPRMLDTRGQSLKYNPGSQKYEWGRIRMLGTAVRHLGLSTVGSLLKQLNGNDKDIVNIAKKIYKEKQAYFAEQEQDFDMTESEFVDLYIKGVRSEFKELALALGLIALLIAARNAAPDEDDDPQYKGGYRWMLRALDKFQDEVSFFYNPTSFTNIVNGSVFPAVGLLVEIERFLKSGFLKLFYTMLGDDQAAASQHPSKYLFKIMPITKELITYLAIFNEDIAKYYGIRISSQNGSFK